MGLREIKAAARAQLHNAMKVPALYYAPGSAVAVPISVRVHTKLNKQLGDLKGTNLNYAETEETIPTLVFWKSEKDPVNKAVVMISNEEGYRIGHVRPPDGLTVTAEVAPLTNAELRNYEAP